MSKASYSRRLGQLPGLALMISSHVSWETERGNRDRHLWTCFVERVVEGEAQILGCGQSWTGTSGSRLTVSIHMCWAHPLNEGLGFG